MHIDYLVFPDMDELPTDFSTIEARADYIARICGAWDFGQLPTPETLSLLCSWREAFDRFPVPASPALRRIAILARLADRYTMATSAS